MAALVVTHARIATMRGGKYSILEDGAVRCEGWRIAGIGPSGDIVPHERDQVIDAGGALLTPGLVDCHTHLVYAGDRTRDFEMRMEGLSYADIAKAGGGIVSTVKATRAASDDDLRAASARRLEAIMASGATTVEIKSGYGLDTGNELRCLRIARGLASDHPVQIATTLLGAHAIPPEFEGRADAYIDEVCGTMIPMAASDHLADAVDGFCETIAFTREQVRRVFETARKHGLRVKLHADQLSDSGGAALAAEFDAISADHLEHSNEEGITALAKAGSVAVMLPGAFYFLRETQVPPIELLRQHGVRMAVATDCNPGTSPLTSLPTAMNMACTLFRMTPEEALAGTTCHAARALGLGDRGTIEVRKRADLALWDVEHPAHLAWQIAGLVPRAIIHAGKVTRRG
ncbi:MAG TPA: imidazolonepropionase [Usitatibacter sp.]|nr:imidazolonepropionase [Usitatibacter sp.]